MTSTPSAFPGARGDTRVPPSSSARDRLSVNSLCHGRRANTCGPARRSRGRDRPPPGDGGAGRCRLHRAEPADALEQRFDDHLEAARMLERPAEAQRDHDERDQPDHELNPAPIEQAVDLFDPGVQLVAALHVSEHVVEGRVLHDDRHHRTGDRAHEQRRKGRLLAQREDDHEHRGQEHRPQQREMPFDAGGDRVDLAEIHRLPADAAACAYLYGSYRADTLRIQAKVVEGKSPRSRVRRSPSSRRWQQCRREPPSRITGRKPVCRERRG